jgi:hypothetical protein
MRYNLSVEEGGDPLGVSTAAQFLTQELIRECLSCLKRVQSCSAVLAPPTATTARDQLQVDSFGLLILDNTVPASAEG